jgi:hypothetical protein
MSNNFSKENLIMLIKSANDDIELLAFLSESLNSFVEYQQAIYQQEIYMMMFSHNNQSKEDYQDKVVQLDKSRTACHNAVIASVNAMNRLAEQRGIPTIYDGIISEDSPYRRQVADTVINFINTIISERR